MTTVFRFKRVLAYQMVWYLFVALVIWAIRWTLFYSLMQEMAKDEQVPQFFTMLILLWTWKPMEIFLFMQGVTIDCVWECLERAKQETEVK